MVEYRFKKNDSEVPSQMRKIESLCNIDVVVIGYEKNGKLIENGGINYLLLALMDKEGKFRSIGKTEMNFDKRRNGEKHLNDMNKDEWYKRFQEIRISNKFYNYYGKPIQMIIPKYIFKISYESALIRDPRQTNELFLHYSDQVGDYTHTWSESEYGNKFISLLQIKFIDDRNDKSINRIDLRMTQVPEFAEEFPEYDSMINDIIAQKNIDIKKSEFKDKSEKIINDREEIVQRSQSGLSFAKKKDILDILKKNNMIEKYRIRNTNKSIWINEEKGLILQAEIAKKEHFRGFELSNYTIMGRHEDVSFLGNDLWKIKTDYSGNVKDIPIAPKEDWIPIERKSAKKTTKKTSKKKSEIVQIPQSNTFNLEEFLQSMKNLIPIDYNEWNIKWKENNLYNPNFRGMEFYLNQYIFDHPTVSQQDIIDNWKIYEKEIKQGFRENRELRKIYYNHVKDILLNIIKGHNFAFIGYQWQPEKGKYKSGFEFQPHRNFSPKMDYFIKYESKCKIDFLPLALKNDSDVSDFVQKRGKFNKWIFFEREGIAQFGFELNQIQINCSMNRDNNGKYDATENINPYGNIIAHMDFDVENVDPNLIKPYIKKISLLLEEMNYLSLIICTSKSYHLYFRNKDFTPLGVYCSINESRNPNMICINDFIKNIVHKVNLPVKEEIGEMKAHLPNAIIIDTETNKKRAFIWTPLSLHKSGLVYTPVSIDDIDLFDVPIDCHPINIMKNIEKYQKMLFDFFIMPDSYYYGEKSIDDYYQQWNIIKNKSDSDYTSLEILNPSKDLDDEIILKTKNELTFKLIKKLGKRNNYQYNVILNDQRIGFVEFSKKNGYIYYIEINSEFTKLGIAEAIYLFIEDLWKKEGLHKIEFECYISAKQFWEKMGCHEIGEIDDSVTLMAKDLEPF